MTDSTTNTGPTPTNAELIAGTAAAFLPLAGPYGVLADNLLTAGLGYWANFQAQKAKGALTMADLEAAAAKVNTDLAAFRQAVLDAGIPLTE